MAVVVRHEQIRHGLVVPGIFVRSVCVGIAADANGFGIGPLGRYEENLRSHSDG